MRPFLYEFSNKEISLALQQGLKGLFAKIMTQANFAKSLFKPLLQSTSPHSPQSSTAQ
jgi:hypothetical protein